MENTTIICCPACQKPRLKIAVTARLIKFPLYCKTCKKEFVINYQK